MVQEVERRLLLVQAQDQAGLVSGVAWSCEFGFSAAAERVLALSEVREGVVGIGVFPTLDARYVVKGYQRRWRAMVPPSLPEYSQRKGHRDWRL